MKLRGANKQLHTIPTGSLRFVSISPQAATAVSQSFAHEIRSIISAPYCLCISYQFQPKNLQIRQRLPRSRIRYARTFSSSHLRDREAAGQPADSASRAFCCTASFKRAPICMAALQSCLLPACYSLSRMQPIGIQQTKDNNWR
jgi:hypothetical protein